MEAANDQMYNLVIVPTTAFESGQPRYQLSATRGDRGRFLVSPEWTELEVRAALAAAGLSPLQTHELFRGNRMAFGRRDTRLLLFDEERLLLMGLVDRVPDQG